jgi:hypothetical protein
MGLVLTWLSIAYPSQYPLSAGLFYHAKAIPHLRQRLSQGLHDDETYLSILCVMQTEVRSQLPNTNQSFLTEQAVLGNMDAFTAHQQGLKVLSATMKSSLNDYCRSSMPR